MWVRGLKLSYLRYMDIQKHVAPRVGAWIETRPLSWPCPRASSHPVWVRGLKHGAPCATRPQEESHPVWVRGLKPTLQRGGLRMVVSHPVWVRGLKHL